MKTRLDMDKITRGLGAERRGKVAPSGGYFGAMQIVADIEARIRGAARGGGPTAPNWTKKRLVRLKPRTLERLGELTAKVQGRRGLRIEVMQLAALLLEKATEQLGDDEAKELVRPRRRASR